jgi:hypothetical protein
LTGAAVLVRVQVVSAALRDAVNNLAVQLRTAPPAH